MKLFILTGNVGCGKSAMATKLARKENGVVVNMDCLQEMIGGYVYGRYDNGKKEIYQHAENEIIEKSLNSGFSVVIDRTNMDKKRRKRFIDHGKRHNAEIISYDFGPGTFKGLYRRLLEPRRLIFETWENVWNHMYKKYEKPELSEGFDSIIDKTQEDIEGCMP